jgi:hypothetical protein
MHHLLMNTASSRVIGTRTDGKIVVAELAPHADDFDSFGGIGLD